MRRILEEPTLLISLLKALLLAGAAFGLDIDDGQRDALLGLATALVALGIVNRAVVTPVKKIERVADEVGGNAHKLVSVITGGE